MGNDQIISTSYQQLAHDVKSNDIILLDDGLIKLKVTAAGTDFVNCKVLEGGTLSDHKGINLPGISISQPSFTKKDQQDLLFGIEQGVDFVAMSFVRNADDVLQVKEIINEHKKDILVFAKIEKPEAINDLEKIVNVADGIMIARGVYGNPWIFKEIKEYFTTGVIPELPLVDERIRISSIQLEKSIAWKGELRGIREMRKHWSQYFRGYPNFKPFRIRLMQIETRQEMLGILEEIREFYR